jgi:hypothetical protein
MDMSKFAPGSAEELYRAMVEVAAAEAKDQWRCIEDEVNYQLMMIAQETTGIIAQLAAGEIAETDADLTLHFLEVDLNSALAEFRFLAYDAAQKILSAVFSVIKAALKNLTGVDLMF